MGFCLSVGLEDISNRPVWLHANCLTGISQATSIRTQPLDDLSLITQSILVGLLIGRDDTGTTTVLKEFCDQLVNPANQVTL